MYKLLIATLLGAVTFFGVAQAESVGYRDFRIKLKNNTSYDCVLKKQQIIYGTVLDEVPEVLYRGQSTFFIMKEYGYYKEATDRFDGDLLDALILLTYQCGENESITFLSHKAPRDEYFRERMIRGIVMEKNNVNASFATTYPNIYTSRPSEISWVLSDDSSQPSI